MYTTKLILQDIIQGREITKWEQMTWGGSVPGGSWLASLALLLVQLGFSEKDGKQSTICDQTL